MNYEAGDIVVIEWHPLEAVRGRMAEVITVHVGGPFRQALNACFDLPLDVPWYTLFDVAGQKHAAAHPWLRRPDEIQFVKRQQAALA